MLDFVFQSLSLYFSSGLGAFWFYIFLALLFVCTVPFIIRVFFRR